MKTSLRPLWELATVAAQKPCCVIWEPELAQFGWHGRADGVHPVYRKFTVALNPYTLTNSDNLPNAMFSEVFWHEVFHVMRGHAPLDFRSPQQVATFKARGVLRTSNDDAAGRQRERMADAFAAEAAKLYPTAWLLQRMIVR